MGMKNITPLEVFKTTNDSPLSALSKDYIQSSKIDAILIASRELVGDSQMVTAIG
jgi:hypothetical protein